MHTTTVLFVCQDNSLLGPLAEAYLNNRGNGMVRAFSGGVAPGAALDPSVRRLLQAQNLSAEGLAPKSLDVFLMPMAPRPDRVVLLGEVPEPEIPDDWENAVFIHRWSVAGRTRPQASFSAAAEYFRRIRLAVDGVLTSSDDGANAA